MNDHRDAGHRDSDKELLAGWTGEDERRVLEALGTLSNERPGDGVFDTDAGWSEVAAAARSGGEIEQCMGEKHGYAIPVPTSWIRRGPMMFAMLAVVATVVIVGRSMTPRNHTTSVRAYRTAEAMRSTVTLRGGSTMTLGPSSVATVAGDEITVVGQAYFSIVPDAKHPVVVRTANSIVRVLGTRFSVRQYPSERRSQVVVEEGRVALRSATSRAPDSAVVLAVNMLGVATDSGVTVSTDVSTERYAGWVKGNLSFNETQLADVIAELNRAYGSRIVIADSVLAQQRMYLNVSVSKQSLNTVLDLICDAANARYTRSGKQYVLTPGKGARDTSAPAPRNHTLTQPEKQYGR